ncbi:lactoylglutathione lyase [Lachnospiraceae bacterium]|uniref:VOC family protein n=1 Tax=Extibacter sp. GGCC_0201 TaxID=2731209 RepID=UPI0008335864|nr:VOC family protein [Extibacter sp. GGCC_0201]MBO1721372.1 glyoxalase [Extibacter sp. GGCC_0201]BDF34978.1 lactoylglutathione lyase [Lachnospiraceae bacterium]BDF38980.1 lactoylglutathione lyase [Lachnospiraceae bacterium]
MFDAQRVVQIGVVVKNLDEAMQYYAENFGMGPFALMDSDVAAANYYGQRRPQHNRIALCRLGPVVFELIECLSGDCVHADYLKEHGEGVDHICFQVDNLEEEIKAFEAKGFRYIEGDEREGFAYIDGDKVGGMKIEMVDYDMMAFYEKLLGEQNEGKE